MTRVSTQLREIQFTKMVDRLRAMRNKLLIQKYILRLERTRAAFIPSNIRMNTVKNGV